MENYQRQYTYIFTFSYIYTYTWITITEYFVKNLDWVKVLSGSSSSIVVWAHSDICLINYKAQDQYISRNY